MSLKSTLKTATRVVRPALSSEFRSLASDTNLTVGKMAAWRVRSMEKIASLGDVEFSVSSQWGQDGIVEWLIERAGVPAALQTFVEFGVEDYRVSNTRFLLQNRNWRGLILDGGPDALEAVKADGLLWKHDLTVRQAFITRENINGLIEDAGFGGEIGLLSVDIDGNDYWVWEAISVVRPVICVCEYNAVLGDVHALSVPYDPEFVRTKAHFSNLYFGASLGALRLLAERKGYRFVGTNLAGNDAFFVREDYAGFVDRSLGEMRGLPSRFRESRDQAGGLTFVGGVERLRMIAGMPVIDVVTGAVKKLGELETIYSEAWMRAMTGESSAGEKGRL
jgi:hypothetical protein